MDIQPKPDRRPPRKRRAVMATGTPQPPARLGAGRSVSAPRAPARHASGAIGTIIGLTAALAAVILGIGFFRLFFGPEKPGHEPVPAAAPSKIAAPVPAIPVGPAAPPTPRSEAERKEYADLISKAGSARSPTEAVQFLSRASMINPKDDTLLLKIARLNLSLRRPREASSVLDRVANRTAEFFHLRGETAFQNELMAEAEEAFRRSIELAPSAEARRRLAEVTRLKGLQAGYQTTNAGHFALASKGANQTLADEILSRLERIYQRLSAELDCFEDETIPVILYEDRDWNRAVNAPSWAGGVYDGKIRVPVQGLSPTDFQIERVLKHELVHALLHIKTGGRCPTWIHEGVAQRYEGKSPSEMQYLATRQGIDWRVSNDVLSQYTRALSQVSFLVDRYGQSGMLVLLDAFKTYGDSDQAYQAAFQIDKETFFKQWRSSPQAF